MPVLRNITLGTLFDEVCRRFENRIAVKYKGKELTYGQLDRYTDTLARGFISAGIKKGTRAAVWGNDRPNTVLTFLALEKIGAVAVMLGTSLPENELKTLLELSQAEYIFFDEGFREGSFPDVIRSLESTLLKKRFYIGAGTEEGFESLDDIIGSAEKVSQTELNAAKAAVTPEDIDTILFTSGTTSSSKGVMTTHYSRVNTILAHIAALRATEEDKFCVAIPMFHCFSLTGNILSALMSGASLHFPENRRTKTLFELIQREKITVFHAVPTLFSAMLARNNINDYDISSLRVGVIGGSIYTPEFFKRVSSELNYNLLSSLGQTEATAGFTFCRYDDCMELKAETVGCYIENTEGMIRNIITGEPQPAGETGEICMRGFSVMKCYVNNPEATRETLLPGGWLRTGDMGFIDAAGYLHITGRLKDMIIRGGENISPAEIEQLIIESGKVAETKAVAVPDEHYGEEICACIVLKEGAELTADEVRKLIEAKLAYYKIPKYVLFIDEIPKTSSGKIALGRLKEIARDRLGC